MLYGSMTGLPLHLQRIPEYDGLPQNNACSLLRIVLAWLLLRGSLSTVMTMPPSDICIFSDGRWQGCIVIFFSNFLGLMAKVCADCNAL